MTLSTQQSPNNADRHIVVKIPLEYSGLIDFLRVTYQLCRAKPKIDFIRACDVLKAREEAALSAYVETLVRGLPAALQRGITFRAPGCDEMSFDEAWLLRAIQSQISQDENSLAFLLNSRVKPAARPHLIFLIEKISLCLYQRVKGY